MPSRISRDSSKRLQIEQLEAQPMLGCAATMQAPKVMSLSGLSTQLPSVAVWQALGQGDLGVQVPEPPSWRYFGV